MKTKTLYLITFLIALSSFKPIQNTDEEQIYKITIFIWSKNEKGEEQKKVIMINQDGTLIFNSKIVKDKVNMKGFTISINKFIKEEKLIKEPAFNGLPKVATAPNNGERSVSISIITLKDFNYEKEFDYNSRFIFRKITKSSDENIDLYKYLESNDLAIINKY